MGPSLSHLTKHDVASQIKSLGEAFETYETAIIKNGINGSMLVPDLPEDEKLETFDMIGVSSRVHRRLIQNHFTDMANAKTGGGGGGGGSMTASLLPSPSSPTVLAVTSVFSSLSVGNSSQTPTPTTATSATSSSHASSISSLQPPGPIKTMAFLTHDWGINEDGTKNHDLVMRVNDYLKAHNIVTWFDDERMTGYVKHMMAEGIDNTVCVVVFVSRRYLEKVNSNNINDNCCFEFGHAVSQRGNKIIPVLVEGSLRDPNTWFGIGGAAMGRLLYIDMVNHKDPAAFEKCCFDLKNKILSFVNTSGCGDDGRGRGVGVGGVGVGGVSSGPPTIMDGSSRSSGIGHSSDPPLQQQQHMAGNFAPRPNNKLASNKSNINSKDKNNIISNSLSSSPNIPANKLAKAVESHVKLEPGGGGQTGRLQKSIFKYAVPNPYIVDHNNTNDNSNSNNTNTTLPTSISGTEKNTAYFDKVYNRWVFPDETDTSSISYSNASTFSGISGGGGVGGPSPLSQGGDGPYDPLATLTAPPLSRSIVYTAPDANSDDPLAAMMAPPRVQLGGVGGVGGVSSSPSIIGQWKATNYR